MATIELKNVKKIYDNKVVAVHDFNLLIKDKEFVVFVGPSGCGKSTTLRMVAGLEEISEGTISIDGRVVNDLPPKDRNIAMVFQNYALYPHLSVFDNIAFPLRLMKQEVEVPLNDKEKGELAGKKTKNEALIAKEEAYVEKKIAPFRARVEKLEPVLIAGGYPLNDETKAKLDEYIKSLEAKVSDYEAKGEKARIQKIEDRMEYIRGILKEAKIDVTPAEIEKITAKKEENIKKIKDIVESKKSMAKLSDYELEVTIANEVLATGKRDTTDKEKKNFRRELAKLEKQMKKESQKGYLDALALLERANKAKANGVYPLSRKEEANLKKDLAKNQYKLESIATRKLPTLYRIRHELEDSIAKGTKIVYHKMSNQELYNRVISVADTLGITEYLARKPRALSGGQRQRVAIGRAMVRDSKVLLMDEPLSNLDAKLRNQMRAEIILLRKKIDATFIYVTHDQTEAMTLGDRIVIMKEGGYVQQVGTPQEVFNTPANLFVAGFIGAPQMNFFKEAKLLKDGKDYAVEVKGVKFPLKGETAELLKKNKAEEGDVILGVRPEHLNFSVKPSKSALECELVVSEMMGSELHLHLMTNDGVQIVCRVPTVNLTKEEMDAATIPGSKSYISFESKVAHLFDKETTTSLLHPELLYK